MRDRFRRLPSPSMAVAFIALLAALGGTAVALPGTGTVNSGDIRNSTIRTQDLKNNSAVRTQDIRNSTIRGRDVRNNTLRGPDINEASLGIVPSATNANTATRAITADSANRADAVTGLQITRQARASIGQTIDFAAQGPFSYRLECFDNDPGAGVDLESSLSIVNVSAGDNSMAWGDDYNDDWDQGEEEELAGADAGTGEDIQRRVFTALGSGGSAATGSAGTAATTESAFGGADCIAHVVAGAQ